MHWVIEDTRVLPLWHHQKYITGAAATHVTGKETKELESIYHTTKPNEDFLFQTGPCWQYNKYPDGNWKVLIVTLIISNVWVDVVTSMKHLEAFLCHFSSTSWLYFSFNLRVVYESLFLLNIKAHCTLPSTFFPLPSPIPAQKDQWMLPEWTMMNNTECKWSPFYATFSRPEVDLEDNFSSKHCLIPAQMDPKSPFYVRLWRIFANRLFYVLLSYLSKNVNLDYKQLTIKI